MTYKQAFQAFYYENRKFILFCLTICLVFSMLAYGNAHMIRASEAVTMTETVSALGGEFGEVFAPVAEGYMSSIDTPTVLTILCSISIALDHIPESALTKMGEIIDVDGLEGLADYSFGIIDYNFFRILCVVWFVVTKLLKSNELTHTTAVILEDVETKIGAVVTILVVATQFLANIAPQATVQAAEASQSGGAVQNGFTAVVCFGLLVSVFITYFFVSYFIYFIDIVLLPICSVVGLSSFGVELLKTIGISILFYLSIFHPILFLVVFGAIFLLAVLLFRKAYITIRYFKRIYVKPFFKRFSGFDREISLVSSNAPKKVLNYIGEAKVDVIIPVYLARKVANHDYVMKHDRWWFVSVGNKRFICKPCFCKNDCYCMELQNTVADKMFIKKSLRFFEVFNLEAGEEKNIGRLFTKIHKRMHFVFSMEYCYRFDELKELTGYMDYTIYCNQVKESNKLAKKQLKFN